MSATTVTFQDVDEKSFRDMPGELVDRGWYRYKEYRIKIVPPSYSRDTPYYVNLQVFTEAGPGRDYNHVRGGDSFVQAHRLLR